jgi:methyl-accepting chemotaxis protein
LQSRQREELPPLVAGVTDALGAIEERRELAYRTSVDQAAQYRATGEAIAKLVTSLQIHDITRQQIEHVTDALEQLLPKVPSPLPRSATPVLALQAQQLWSASQVFAASIRQIESELDDIAARAQEMAEASRTLVEASGDERNPFIERMESYFKAIVEAAAGFDQEWLEMQAIATGLEETTERMRAAIAEIRRIEIQIQRIAINAAIGAIHVGSSGQALSVIAEVMQSLAQESNENTERAAVALDEMSRAILRASEGETAPSGIAAPAPDPNDALGSLQSALDDLRASTGAGYARVHQIAAAGTQLSNAIATLRGGFSAGALFREVVQRVHGDLDRIVEEAFPETSAEHQAAHSQELASLAKRYTMQRERDVHESLVNGPAQGAATTEPQTAVVSVAGGEEDLGENVELF